MKLPNYNYENKFLKRGFKNIAGVDEAGRGSWAGPIVASAVIISNFKIKPPGLKIKDSKKLPPFQREKLFKIIKTRAVSWSIGIVNEKIIDKIGVGKANILVFKKAIKNLKIKPDFILFDGNLKVDKIKIPSYNIIKGDEKIFSCSCASIIAKVYRDHLMREHLHQKYPQYGFDRHKGYGTKYHLKMIKKYGICPSHRKSFKPIKNMSLLPLKIPGGNELIDSKEVLEKIGLKEGDKVADLGCGGKGYFSLQATKLVGNKGLVYAVDVLKSALKSVENEAKLQNVYNLKTVWSNLEIVGATKIEPANLDFCLLINILFQTEKHFEVMKEATRLLKKDGKLAIIDWKATGAPFGPPPEMRVPLEEVKNFARQLGLREDFKFEAGKYHYGLVFVK